MQPGKILLALLPKLSNAKTIFQHPCTEPVPQPPGFIPLSSTARTSTVPTWTFHFAKRPADRLPFFKIRPTKPPFLAVGGGRRLPAACGSEAPVSSQLRLRLSS
jgi:hypothetical protein